MLDDHKAMLHLKVELQWHAHRVQPEYRFCPAWAVERRDGALLARGGADELLLLDAVPDAVAGEVLALADEGRQVAALSTEAAALLEELSRLGVVEPRTSREPLRACIRVLDGTDGVLERVETAVRSDGVRSVGDDETADLIVYVRTTATLGSVASAAAEHCAVPHLLVDAAYHHTVSLGPLVVHGETACLRCLADRITNRWGDDPPPPRPAAGRHVDFLAGLVAVQVANIAEGDRSLMNRTVALDLRRWRCVDGTVLKLPGCPGCAPVETSRGRLELPWSR